MRIYLVYEYDFDAGYQLYYGPECDSPKAFLNKVQAEEFASKNEHRRIFEYDIEDFDKQSIEGLPRVCKFREFVANLECTKNDPLMRRFEHAVTGIGTEAGELLTEMKRTVFYDIYDGKVNKDKVEDESCDLLHYLVLLTNVLGVSFDRLIELNEAKLSKRYPNGYSKEAWLNRNKNVERLAMDGVKEGDAIDKAMEVAAMKLRDVGKEGVLECNQ